MWTDLYPVASDELAEAFVTGPVVLSGLPGGGRAALVRDVVGDRSIVEIRPRQAGTAAGLRVDTINAILAALTSSVGGAQSRRDFNRRVVEAFGPHAPRALALASDPASDGLTIAEILQAVPGNAALVVHDAHLLAAPWAERALWALRGRMAAMEPPYLALLTRRWHAAQLIGSEAPFFGFGQALELPVPGIAEWGAVADPRFGEDALRWLLGQTRGLPRPTLGVLARAEAAGVAVQQAWRVHVHESERVALAVRTLVHGLHQYAPRLLAAIAAGDAVYGAVPEARTDAIAAALRAMRDHDVIYQPRPRRWVVADPALIPHLAASSAAEPGRP